MSTVPPHGQSPNLSAHSSMIYAQGFESSVLGGLGYEAAAKPPGRESNIPISIPRPPQPALTIPSVLARDACHSPNSVLLTPLTPSIGSYSDTSGSSFSSSSEFLQPLEQRHRAAQYSFFHQSQAPQSSPIPPLDRFRTSLPSPGYSAGYLPPEYTEATQSTAPSGPEDYGVFGPMDQMGEGDQGAGAFSHWPSNYPSQTSFQAADQNVVFTAEPQNFYSPSSCPVHDPQGNLVPISSHFSATAATSATNFHSAGTTDFGGASANTFWQQPPSVAYTPSVGGAVAESVHRTFHTAGDSTRRSETASNAAWQTQARPWSSAHDVSPSSGQEARAHPYPGRGRPRLQVPSARGGHSRPRSGSSSSRSSRSHRSSSVSSSSSSLGPASSPSPRSVDDDYPTAGSPSEPGSPHPDAQENQRDFSLRVDRIKSAVQEAYYGKTSIWRQVIR